MLCACARRSSTVARSIRTPFTVTTISGSVSLSFAVGFCSGLAHDVSTVASSSMLNAVPMDEIGFMIASFRLLLRQVRLGLTLHCRWCGYDDGARSTPSIADVHARSAYRTKQRSTTLRMRLTLVTTLKRGGRCVRWTRGTTTGLTGSSLQSGVVRRGSERLMTPRSSDVVLITKS